MNNAPDLPELQPSPPASVEPSPARPVEVVAAEVSTSSMSDLQAVYDVPVRVQAVLGRTVMEVSQLLKLGPGAVIDLDRRIGEPVDILINDRLVARGEVVLIDDNLGVTMTEIVKDDRR